MRWLAISTALNKVIKRRPVNGQFQSFTVRDGIRLFFRLWNDKCSCCHPVWVAWRQWQNGERLWECVVYNCRFGFGVENNLCWHSGQWNSCIKGRANAWIRWWKNCKISDRRLFFTKANAMKIGIEISALSVCTSGKAIDQNIRLSKYHRVQYGAKSRKYTLGRPVVKIV